VAVSRLAHVLALDPGHDLALLRAGNVPPHRFARVAEGPVLQGQFAQAMGHSLGLWWSYSSGAVAAVRQIDINDMDLLWVQAAVPISPGNSGGGLFDEDGNLIGIAHATFASPRAQQLNIFVHRDYIRALLGR
jgi:S1-C subfamily serine protease